MTDEGGEVCGGTFEGDTKPRPQAEPWRGRRRVVGVGRRWCGKGTEGNFIHIIK